MVDAKNILSLSDNQAMDAQDKCRNVLYPYLTDNPLILTVSGNIGFGKSSVTRFLRGFNVIPIHENTEDQQLDLYYLCRERRAQNFQVHLAGVRGNQLWQALQFMEERGLSSCIDRSSYEEPLAFILALEAMGDLKHEVAQDLMEYFDLEYKKGREARKKYEDYMADYKRRTRKPDPFSHARTIAELTGTGIPNPDVLIAWTKSDCMG